MPGWGVRACMCAREGTCIFPDVHSPVNSCFSGVAIWIIHFI